MFDSEVGDLPKTATDPLIKDAACTATRGTLINPSKANVGLGNLL